VSYESWWRIMKNSFAITILSILVTLPIIAQARYISGAGHSYNLSCNKNGYTLTSENPVGRFYMNKYGGFAPRLPVYDTEVIYLGTSCDAYSELLGEGKWEWSNAGFRVMFNSVFIDFPRGELMCPLGNVFEYDNDGKCSYYK
tara:strand:+ start:229 stop:657 length:429 start_codon:yes stop_codon:yes gene_type:complete